MNIAGKITGAHMEWELKKDFDQRPNRRGRVVITNPKNIHGPNIYRKVYQRGERKMVRFESFWWALVSVKIYEFYDGGDPVRIFQIEETADQYKPLL